MILLVFLCAVSQISAENPDNATLATDEIQEELSIDEVQTAEDILTDSGEIDYHPFSEIQDAIDDADDGGTISLTGHFKGSGNQIVIDKPITIEGPEDGYAYLTADGISRIFYIKSSGVVLKNLVMRDGDAGYDDGGAVCCDANDNCVIYNCIIGYCEADYGGATYYCDVYQSAFLANSATYGGAMYGGNAYYTGFANNTASDRGGAIYLKDGCTVDHCEFENNTAEYGGAVYSCADYNIVSNSNFNNNNASDDGGDSTMLMMMAVQYTPLAMLIPLSETVTSGIIKQDTGEAQCVEVLHTIPHSTLTVLMKMVVECITVKHLTAHLHGTPLIMYMEPMSTD